MVGEVRGVVAASCEHDVDEKERERTKERASSFLESRWHAFCVCVWLFVDRERGEKKEA